MIVQKVGYQSFHTDNVLCNIFTIGVDVSYAVIENRCSPHKEVTFAYA